MRSINQILSFLLLLICSSISMNAQQSTDIFKNGNDELIIYNNIPGLLGSEHYKVRVRSNATNNKWKESFALVTRSLAADAKAESGSYQNYFDNLEGWTHTYTNFEMNAAVEIEISKFDGSPIIKAAVHPVAKGSKPTIMDGKVYFTMEKPALVAVDIDGQMDDHNTGRYPTEGGKSELYSGPPVHAITIFAHPIMDKPKFDEKGVVIVEPGTAPPTDPKLYNTVYFAPGVHNIGLEYPLHKNKQYFIPGDAIVYGTMGNHERGNGENIKIYGVGTLSGDSIKHPKYDPKFPGYPNGKASPVNGRPWKAISIIDALNVKIEGICLANPAFHAISLPVNSKKKVTTMRWAKVISWRGNGDGIGNAHIAEDCFLRTQDDATYIKGDRRRLVIWNDANGSSFVMQGIIKDFPILVEDCDIIYARAKWHQWNGGRVFCGRPINGKGKRKVNVLFRDIRIEDTRPTLQIFNIYSKSDFEDLLANADGSLGQSYSGITFQNISAVATSVMGLPEVFHGSEESPYDNWTFENVMLDGKLFTQLSDFAKVNDWITDITFNPEVTDDATLFDIYLDGVSIPEFKADKENYTLYLPAGTVKAPKVSATHFDYDASMSISQSESLPGKATITVTAEDRVTTKKYTINIRVNKQ